MSQNTLYRIAISAIHLLLPLLLFCSFQKAQGQSLSTSISQTSFIVCFNDYTAALSVNASGGTNPYSYIWSTGDTSQLITSLNAGTYSVTVTDFLGNTATASYTISQPASIIISVVVDSNASCAGYADGGATIFASGGNGSYTYNWSTGDATQSVSNLSSGSYIAAVFDSNGCSVNTTVVITEPTSVYSYTSIEQQISCYGTNNGQALIGATGGTPPYSFIWSNGSNDTLITGLSVGNYSVTVFDSIGCFDTNSIQLSQPDSMIAAVVIDSNITCQGDQDGVVSASIAGGTGPFSALWSNGFSGLTLNNLSPGSYSATITDFYGCSDSSSIILSAPALLQATTTVLSNLACYGDSNGSATVLVSGGWIPYSFVWSNGILNDTNNQLTAGVNFVSITDSNGCAISDSAIITSPTEILLALSITDSIQCFGDGDGSISASISQGSPPYSIVWSNGDTLPISSGLASGMFSVTISDNNGCFRSDSIALSSPDSIASIITSQNVNCFGETDGEASVNVTGGIAPYNYLWSNGSNDQQVLNLPSGEAIVTVTDQNGCLHINQDSIGYDHELPILNLGPDTMICEGQSFVLDAGNASSLFTWSTFETTQSITASSAGIYWVEVTDQNDCKNSDSILVEIDPCLGINQTSNTLLVRITPNPSNGNFSIQCNRELNGTIEIYSQLGQILYRSEKFASSTFSKSLHLDLPSGVHFLIFSSEEFVHSQQIVIK